MVCKLNCFIQSSEQLICFPLDYFFYLSWKFFSAFLHSLGVLMSLNFGYFLEDSLNVVKQSSINKQKFIQRKLFWESKRKHLDFKYANSCWPHSLGLYPFPCEQLKIISKYRL